MVRAFSTVAPGLGAPRVRTGSSDHPAFDPFDAFVAEIFERLPRADQRRWAHVYTRGLLMTPGRKTVRRLAASVSDSATAAQALHQFVNASPWDWEPVRARLADWVARRSGPRALLLGTAVLPKRGDRSCGVHRRFVPQEGRTVNCQVGIGAFLAGDRATVPVDWRLLLPGAWSADPQVRDRARVPEDAAGTQDSGEAQALALVDGVLPGSGTDPDGIPVVADLVGFADTAALVAGLVSRRRRFVLAVPGDLTVLPDRTVPGASRAPTVQWAGVSGAGFVRTGGGGPAARDGGGSLPRTDGPLTVRAGRGGPQASAGGRGLPAAVGADRSPASAGGGLAARGGGGLPAAAGGAGVPASAGGGLPMPADGGLPARAGRGGLAVRAGGGQSVPVGGGGSSTPAGNGPPAVAGGAGVPASAGGGLPMPADGGLSARAGRGGLAVRAGGGQSVSVGGGGSSTPAGNGPPAVAGGAGVPASAGGGLPMPADGGLSARAGRGGLAVRAGGGQSVSVGGGGSSTPAGNGPPAVAGGAGVPASAGGGLPMPADGGLSARAGRGGLAVRAGGGQSVSVGGGGSSTPAGNGPPAAAGGAGVPRSAGTGGLLTAARAGGPASRGGVGRLLVRDLLAGQDAWSAQQPSVVSGVPVRLPGVPVPLRLMVERRPDEAGGDRFWLTDLVERPAREVPALARLHSGAADTLERLADDFGLRAFEGRSYPGWHHHMTLVSAAFAYGALGRAGTPPTHPARASRGPQPGRPPRRARTLTTPTRTGCS
ncbi:transposase [Streptomyces sp. NPDC102270]|uniref:IS701 family transposase n=1 Tax=Streptomyces sp. NPDC102270 TaxID=3366150 RepID=UPI0037FE9E94